MVVQDVRNDPVTNDLGEVPSRVAPMSELEELEVADGYPEIRGWDVRDASGRSIGYVCDLLVDLEGMRVRYLDVELDPEFATSDADRRVLIPLDRAGLDGGGEEILLHGIDAAEVHALVPWARRGVAREAPAFAPTPAVPGLADVASSGAPAVEREVELPRERQYDDERLFGLGASTPQIGALAGPVPPVDGLLDLAETPEADASRPTVPSAAGAALAAREVVPADVRVRTTVETQQIREEVPVVREEVEVERRALRPGEVIESPQTSDDEIRIPIMAEELVVQKRLVAKEVLVIRKRRVTEQRTVEAELRREEVHVEDPLGGARPIAGPEGPGKRA